MPFPKKTVNFDTENRVLFFAENWNLKIEAVPDLPSFAAVYTYHTLTYHLLQLYILHSHFHLPDSQNLVAK